MSTDPTAADSKPWWKGARGEWLVVGAGFLILLVFFGPCTVAGWPAWPFPPCVPACGRRVMIAGGMLFVVGLVRLGGG